MLYSSSIAQYSHKLVFPLSSFLCWVRRNTIPLNRLLCGVVSSSHRTGEEEEEEEEKEEEEEEEEEIVVTEVFNIFYLFVVSF